MKKTFEPNVAICKTQSKNTTLCDRTLCDQTLCDQTSQENPRIDERSQVATNSPRLSNTDTHDSKIHELRKQIRTLETISRNSDDEAVISSGSSALDAILPAKGFARGTLIEWIAHSNQSSRPNHSPQQRLHQNEMDGSGVMMLAFAAAKEACRDGGMFVIMDQHRTFFPPAALALGFRSRQLVVIQPKSKKDLDWSLHQALNCPAVATVWAALDEVDEYAFRRFQLAAESSGCIGLLGRSANAIAQPSWSEMQLAVTPQSRGIILGNRIPANSQLRQAPQRHHKNFSANRFLQIELIRSHQGQCGGKVMIEIDSYYGDIRKAASHQSPLQKAAASVDTEFPNAKPSTNAMLKNAPQKNVGHASNHDRQQTTAMDSKHGHSKKKDQIAKTNPMSVVSQLANSAADRRKTGT